MDWLRSDYGLLMGYVLFAAVVAVYAGRNRPNRLGDQAPAGRPPEQGDFLSELAQPIENLLKSGVKDASLEISFEGLGLIVILQKYIKSEGDYGLAVIYPNSQGNESSFAQAVSYCEKNSVPFTHVEKGAVGSNLDVGTFEEWSRGISIDFSQDLDRVIAHLRSFVVEVLGVPKKTEISYRYIGGTRPGELVDRPDQVGFSSRERWAYSDSALRLRTGWGLIDTAVFVIFTLITLCSYAAFIYSIAVELIVLTFSVETEWSGIEFEIIELSVKAKWFDIVWILLFLSTFLAILTRSYWVDRLRKEGKNWRTVISSDWHLNRSDLIRSLRAKLAARSNFLVLLVIALWIQF